LSLQCYWEQEGDDILKRVGAQHPELIFAGMVKLANVMRVEVGPPGDFSGLSKQEIVDKLEQREGGLRADGSAANRVGLILRTR
jgi:hypothetical protein